MMSCLQQAKKKLMHDNYAGDTNFFPTEMLNGAFKENLNDDQLSLWKKQLGHRLKEIEKDLVKYFGDRDRVSFVFC